MTGTGLGLWVSAEIIQKHAGTVRVRSRAASPSTTALDNGNNGTMPEKSTPATGTIFMMFFPENAVAAALQPATMAQRR
jgi:signal transduction histidine kinase